VGELGVDVVIESDRLFTDRESAAKHLEQGAKRSSSRGLRPTPTRRRAGVNFDEVYDRSARRDLERIVHDELPAPVAKVVNDAVGIKHG